MALDSFSARSTPRAGDASLAVWRLDALQVNADPRGSQTADGSTE